MLEGWQRGRCYVSDEHRFIYFEMPKVACTSVKKAILPLMHDRRNDAPEEVLAVHSSLDESDHRISKVNVVRGVKNGGFKGYLRFSFVRNPWDRLYSCYRSKIRENVVVIRQTEYEGGTLRPAMSFEDFVRVVCGTLDLDSNPHFCSQHLFLRGPAGGMLTNYVGRFESLVRDFRVVAERLGLSELPHMNPSQSAKGYREMYTREMIDAVGERYADDVNLFGYRFE